MVGGKVDIDKVRIALGQTGFDFVPVYGLFCFRVENPTCARANAEGKMDVGWSYSFGLGDHIGPRRAFEIVDLHPLLTKELGKLG